MNTRTVTRTHVVCPNCDETDAEVDHLEAGREFGPWYCKSCRRAYWGVAAGENTKVWNDTKSARSIQTLVLLEYPPCHRPLRFILEHSRYINKTDMARESAYGGARYYFEEHSCPTNWLRNAVMVSYDGDTDPHGFLRFAREIERPDLPDNCMERDQALIALFPEMLDQGTIEPR